MTVFRDTSPSPFQVEQITTGPKDFEDIDHTAGLPKMVESSKVVDSPGRWRRALGILALMTVVFLWTASNFLASDLLADRSYNKPFMVTYANTASFIIPLIPILISKAYQNPEELREWRRHWRTRLFRRQRRRRKSSRGVELPAEPFPQLATAPSITRGSDINSTRRNYYTVDPPNSTFQQSSLLNSDAPTLRSSSKTSSSNSRLSLLATARVSLEFCTIWFLANYFITACLEYTTVASSTILTSTSSIFTLFVGWQQGVEHFTLSKAGGVLASFLGVALIASLDASGKSNGTDPAHRGDFPEKTREEILLGDAIALCSAALYGVYSVLMKKRLGDEGRVNMPTFFGFVGVFNVLLAWPGFLLLHFSGIEPFALPPSFRVCAVLLLNSATSLLADMAWAFAVLLTSPIVVSVGLSLSIPVSLIGQVLVNGQTTTAMYWVGAAVVVVSFVFVNMEDEKEGEKASLEGSLRGSTTMDHRRGSIIGGDEEAASRFGGDSDDEASDYDDAMATSVDRLLR